MAESFSSPLANSLTLTLVHFLWQGSLIGLGYWALLAAADVRSARIRYATSLLALSVMALCPVVTFAVVYDSNTAVDVMPVLAVATSSSDRADTPAAGRQAANESASEFGAARGERRGFAVLQSALEASQLYVLLLWLAGVMLSGARLTAGILNVIRLRSGRTEIPAELAERSLMLARRLGLKSARIFASRRIRDAAVVGFWKPVVLLPASWLTSLPTDVLEAVIAHELAHIRRFDVWINLLQRFLETLLFYHPAIWWLSNQIRLEREMCCDDLAVHATGERGKYAIALEQVARLQVHRGLSLAPSFTGEKNMNLLSRIHNLLVTENKKSDRGPACLVGIVALAVPLVFGGVGGAFTSHNAAVAQEREAAPRRLAEGGSKRRSAEAEAEPRRSAEGEGSRVVEEFRPQNQREATLFKMIHQLQNELAAWKREVQTRENGRGEGLRDGEVRRVARPDGFSLTLEAPTTNEVIRALPAAGAQRKNVRVVCELLVDRLNESRFYPLVGVARLRQVRFKCTVYSDAGKEVVYIDHDTLIHSQ